MLCPSELAAPSAPPSSYWLSVGHVSCLPPSQLEMGSQINDQMDETLARVGDASAG